MKLFVKLLQPDRAWKEIPAGGIYEVLDIYLDYEKQWRNKNYVLFRVKLLDDRKYTSFFHWRCQPIWAKSLEEANKLDKVI